MSSSLNDALIEALARRADRYEGEARRVLDARLAALRAQKSLPPAMQPACPSLPVSRGPLGQLADSLVARHQHREPLHRLAGPAGSVPTPQFTADRELSTLRQFRGSWARLSAEQRLRQALAQVPAQAGPLNSNHLVHRALVAMQEISPAYLQRFVNYVDTLLWLDQQQTATSPAATSARQEKRRGTSKARK